MSFSLRVAIADDDPRMRALLQQMLGRLGHKVVAVAENGPSLIDLCAKTHPNVVITGTLTPEMYGSDAAAIIYKSRPIPIILCSDHCGPFTVRNAEHKHVSMCLVKPVRQEDLQVALKECQRTEPDEPLGGEDNVIRGRFASRSFGSEPSAESGSGARRHWSL
jgi:CheY-like chemotaxis protein